MKLRQTYKWTEREREREFWIRQIHRQRKKTDRQRERREMLALILRSLYL